MSTGFDAASMVMLGLLGTGHCLGMCGPLVIALTTHSGLSAHLFYHLGRLTTYTLVGAVSGSIGAGLVQLASAAGANELLWLNYVQVWFSFGSAAFLLIFGLVRLGILREPGWLAIASPAGMPGFDRVQQGVVRHRNSSSFFLLGLMLGFLPCGLSYAAFARALSSNGPIDGALLVSLFGIGTLPGLLLLGTSATEILRRHRKVSDILSALLMIGMAASLFADALQALLS